MPITLHDRAPLEKVRRLSDGRIAAVAKFARSGCYTYAGSEVGRPDLQAVTVYRPETEVFDQAAMASFAHKAITLDHPAESVTAANWKAHSVGWTEGKVARDGEFVEIPLMLADAAAVQAYDAGKRDLSAGYTCDLVWGAGIAPDRTPYDAIQRNLRGNHIALVSAGRAGSECRIGDSMQNNQASADAATIVREVARMSNDHRTKFAWLGDQAPTFNEANARAVATAKVQHDWAHHTRRAAYEGSQLAEAKAGYDAARAQLSDERSNAGRGESNLSSVRDLARSRQY